ncbi:hypothetical protein AVEN_175068-1, partial [Araneus ventricosus]
MLIDSVIEWRNPLRLAWYDRKFGKPTSPEIHLDLVIPQHTPELVPEQVPVGWV